MEHHELNEALCDDFIRDEVRQHPLYKNRSSSSLVNAVVQKAREVEPSKRLTATMAGLDVIEQIRDATNEQNWGNEEPEFRIWRHVRQPILAGKKRLDPYIQIQQVQDATAAYLDLPYRVETLDRILVDMLVASEMYAFADEIQPLLKQKLPILLRWLLDNVVSLVGAGVVAGSIIWMWPESTMAYWIAGIIFGVIFLMSAWSLVAYPFFYPRVRRHLQKTLGIIDAMLDAYAALGGEPASVKHVQERINRATDAGAVWPAQLFVLIEDIKARTASF